MNFGRLNWTPLQPFGAAVEFDLREPLHGDEAAQLKSLLFEHQLLVFRKQQLDHPQQIAVMEYIEPVLRLPEFVHYISSDEKKGALGTQRLPYHSDLSFAGQLRLAISLHAVDLVDGGSSTRFVSALRAADQLPAALRQRLAGRRALHVMPWRAHGVMHRDAYDDTHLAAEPPEWVPRHAHPVILPHPVTGRPVLYVNEMLTARIEGLEPAESRTLLADLYDHLYATDNRLEHVWHMGDLLLWDNVALQHARGDVSACGPRTLQKVQLGRTTLEQQWPNYNPDQMRQTLSGSADRGI